MTLDTTFNILVASDDAALAAAVTSSLRTNGFHVCSAQQCQNHPPRLIVLDADMSAEARAQLLDPFRAESPRTAPPIVALAARDSLKATTAEQGVWVCLAKPIELDSLLSAVDRISRYTAA
ncbi:MAG: hypothetical protein JO057_17450 [Chloroflexi bacterium]|nr:hypothetical protein [Chloroflexota bacterium]